MILTLTAFTITQPFAYYIHMNKDLIRLYTYLLDGRQIRSNRQTDNTFVIRIELIGTWQREAYRFILDETTTRAIKERNWLYY